MGSCVMLVIICVWNVCLLMLPLHKYNVLNVMLGIYCIINIVLINAQQDTTPYKETATNAHQTAQTVHHLQTHVHPAQTIHIFSQEHVLHNVHQQPTPILSPINANLVQIQNV